MPVEALIRAPQSRPKTARSSCWRASCWRGR